MLPVSSGALLRVGEEEPGQQGGRVLARAVCWQGLYAGKSRGRAHVPGKTQLSPGVEKLHLQITNRNWHPRSNELLRVTHKPAVGLCEDPGLLPSSPWIYLLKPLPQALGPNRTKRAWYLGEGLHTLSANPYWSKPNSLFKQRQGFKPLQIFLGWWAPTALTEGKALPAAVSCV